VILEQRRKAGAGSTFGGKRRVKAIPAHAGLKE
jgi:hypothetical protein